MEDIVVTFLEENKVQDSWRQLILENDDIKSALKACLEDIVNSSTAYLTFSFPERRYILRALTYLPPKDTKAVFIGHEPIPGDLATGLAFSFPRGRMSTQPSSDPDVERDNVVGKSVFIVHDVLCRAGFLKQGEKYDCCAKVWARRGVLLWNGALTYPAMDDEIKDLWTRFGVKLFTRLLEINHQIPILCTGTCGGIIGDELKKIEGTNVTVCHHPTFPKESISNNFKIKGEEFFKAVYATQPTLFTLTPEVDNVEEKIQHVNLNE